MPSPRPRPLGAPCWVDLMTSDTAGARTFYGELFGWTAADPNEEFGGYFNFSKDGQLVAGCMGKEPDSPMPDIWSIYLEVADAEATVAAVPEHGGQVFAPAMQVGDLGTMAVLGDAGGAMIGLWQPGQHDGFGLVDEPGFPGWWELHTSQYEAALTFYREVFGWTTSTMSDTPEFRYSVLVDADGQQFAGVMDSTGHGDEGTPPFWTVYFRVADADATVEHATRLGATTIMSPEDTPYGRLGVLSDPSGARFNIVGPNPES